MASNALDDLLVAIRKTWDDVGFSITPLSIFFTLAALLLPFLTLFILALSQREEPLPPPTGCRKLGHNGPSNLRDQFLKKYAQGSEKSPSNPWKVKALFIYPIKSCASVELEEANVIRTGLKYDRQFTFAQHVTSLPSLEGKVESKWVFITQRTFPRLAKVETEIWFPDAETPGYKKDGEWVQSEGCLVVRFPFTPDVDFSLQGLKNYGKILAARLDGKSEPTVEFRIPFNPSKERQKSRDYPKQQVSVWDENPTAVNMGCEVPEDVMAKLKYTLGITNPLTLFRIDTEKYREVHKNAPKKTDVGFQTIIGMQDSVRLSVPLIALTQFSLLKEDHLLDQKS